MVQRFEEILEWYSGKSRDTIVNFTIPALVESDALGYWKKGVAISVRASLNKMNVAANWAKAVERELEVDWSHPLNSALSDMRHGSYGDAVRLLTKDASTKRNAKSYFYTKKGAAQNVNETIDRWAWSFAKVNALITLLDDSRPKPVVVMKTLSPTVAKTISDHIGIDVSTIQSPLMHGEYREFEWKGKMMRVWFVVIDWPKGTLHNKSRFLNTDNNMQCHACGHAIKNRFNWVPILAYGRGTKTAAYSKDMPFSLWVGRDCAGKLFGCEVEGEAVYDR